MSRRKNHASAFKAKMARASLSREKTIAELSSEFGVHQTLIHKWVTQLKESVASIFSGEIKTENQHSSRSSLYGSSSFGVDLLYIGIKSTANDGRSYERE